MSDSFQTIVDVECLDEAEAASLGRRVLEALIARGIVGAEPANRADVPEDGHAPGPRFVEALAEPRSDEEHLRTVLMNVVQVIAQRSVHHGGDGGVELICPRCGARQEPPLEWGDAVGEWFEEGVAASVACGACGGETTVTEYGYDPPYGFSCLGISFWNWRPLSDAFVHEVGELLGHRVILVSGSV